MLGCMLDMCLVIVPKLITFVDKSPYIAKLKNK
jgi:hypothetical protein